MSKIYQIKVQLRDLKPSSYRIILVESTDIFYDLHAYILNLFNFCGGHLFEFEVPAGEFCQTVSLHHPDDDGGGSYESKRSDDAQLKDYLTCEKETCSYTYDFGDNWEFDITLQKIFDSKDLDIKKFPHLKKAQGINCIDDCGGVWALEELVSLYEKKDYKELGMRLQGEEGDTEEIKEIIENIVNPDFDDFELTRDIGI